MREEARAGLTRMEKRRVIMFIRAFKFDPSTWYTTSLSRTGPGELDSMNGTVVKYVGPFGQIGGERDTLNIAVPSHWVSPPPARSHWNSQTHRDSGLGTRYFVCRMETKIL
jgi:hypothetical protein